MQQCKNKAKEGAKEGRDVVCVHKIHAYMRVSAPCGHVEARSVWRAVGHVEPRCNNAKKQKKGRKRVGISWLCAHKIHAYVRVSAPCGHVEARSNNAKK
jgi:hypothetical protein